MLTPSTLHRFPRRGQDYFLSIAEPHNPQPFLDPSASYLFGPAGQEGGMEMGEDGRAVVGMGTRRRLAVSAHLNMREDRVILLYILMQREMSVLMRLV